MNLLTFCINSLELPHMRNHNRKKINEIKINFRNLNKLETILIYFLKD